MVHKMKRVIETFFIFRSLERKNIFFLANENGNLEISPNHAEIHLIQSQLHSFNHTEIFDDAKSLENLLKQFCFVKFSEIFFFFKHFYRDENLSDKI